MAKRRKRSNKSKTISLLSIILAVLVILFSKFYDNQKKEIESHITVSDNEVVAHIIDVGQGSCALIQCGKSGILIDSGEAEYGQKICDYIKSYGVATLEYVIASHPHSDHIGGMRKVIKNFDVKHFVMPLIDDENIPTTATYEKLLITLDEKNIDTVFWEYGDADTLKIENVTVQLLAPTVQNDNLNNMSIICKVAAFNTIFIFPGDAEKAELKALMKTQHNIRADVMIMSHHGSANALYEPFLNAADPSVAVISCGTGNSYGHPHREILDYIDSRSMLLYRTDEEGSIRFICNEEGYAVYTDKG